VTAYLVAGRYNEVLFINGRIAANTDVQVVLTGTSLGATLYSDSTKAVVISSTVRTDTGGNLAFYADPGMYDLLVRGQRVSAVPVDISGPVDYSFSAISVKPSSTDDTDWKLYAFEVPFEAGLYNDKVLMLGNNFTGSAGNPMDPTESQVWLQFESKFRNPAGPGPYGSEFHLNMKPPGALSGTQRRPFNFFMEHTLVKNYGEFDIETLEIWDSARAIQAMIFDAPNKVLRFPSGGYPLLHAATGAGTDNMYLASRSVVDGETGVYRLQAHCAVTLGNVFNQHVGVLGGALVVANKTAGPTAATFPVGAFLNYSDAGVPKWLTPLREMTVVAVAQGPYLLESPLEHGQDAGFAGTGPNIYASFTVRKTEKVNRVCGEVGASAGSVQVGIYDSVGGVPGNRLATSGTVACPAAGGFALAVPETTLQPGKYFAALASNNGGATFRYRSGMLPAKALGGVYYTDASAFPLQAVANPTVEASANAFLMVPAYV
jgi:hypothetical protein